ncbi:hypothetical protein [Actinoplanes sp. CA-252034]|uniref:hypothetical protein n=1 Tax=Actinoplanes sp. CA-252034 TaxID=3239906 RepID=UPI003D95D67E
MRDRRGRRPVLRLLCLRRDRRGRRRALGGHVHARWQRRTVGRPEHPGLDLDHPDRWQTIGHGHGTAVHRGLGLVGPERLHVPGRRRRLGSRDVDTVGVLVRHG